jgi:hypothetical protein
MSRLRFNSLAADPSAPAAGKIEVYGRTVDKLARLIDENAVVRKIGNVYCVSNTADLGPTAGADFYLTASAVPVSQLLAGSKILWRISATKTAACTGTPAFNIRCGTAQSTADTALATSTGLAQTAATDTGLFEIEAIIRAVTSTGTIAWSMRLAHKNAATGFANAAQDQIFNGTSAAHDFTVAGKYLGISINPTNTTANGVWTFQTVSAEVLIA